MEAASEVRAPQDDMGRRLRAERERQGISLRRLAGTLAISPSALSQIETGQSRPSVSTLYAIVSELGISLDEVFSGASAPAASNRSDGGTDKGSERPPARFGDDLVQRANERKIIILESGARWERLNPTGDRGVDFLEIVYEVGGASSPGDTFMRHSGREYGLVMSGRLKVTVGFEEHELEPGDSICFDSSVPHRLQALGDEPARAIWFVMGRDGSDARATWDGSGG